MSGAEALRELVVEKVAEKITEKATRHEQLAAKAAVRARAFDKATEQLHALAVWTRHEPIARKPRFSRDEIAATAISIADADGFGAVSMRRLALQLDAGTMTLYHYVRTKDELLTLVVDAVMGEVVVPTTELLPTHWRDAVTMIAERTRDALTRHPWILDITDDPPLGPNAVRHFDQSLQAVASLPISLPERFDIVTAIDEYVFGYCLHQRNHLQNDGDDAPDDGVVGYVDDLIATGEYPQLAAMADEYGLERAWDQIGAHLRDPGRFARNLERLLDGIEASLVDSRNP